MLLMTPDTIEVVLLVLDLTSAFFSPTCFACQTASGSGDSLAFLSVRTMEIVSSDVVERLLAFHVWSPTTGTWNGGGFTRFRSVCKEWRRVADDLLLAEHGPKAEAFFSRGMGISFAGGDRAGAILIPRKLLYRHAFAVGVDTAKSRRYRCSACGREKAALMETSCCVRARKETARVAALRAQTLVVLLAFLSLRDLARPLP